jgi:hypothetical protein
MLTWLLDTIRGSQDRYAGDSPAVEANLVRVRVRCPRCLNVDQVHRLGESSGRSYWWLRHAEGWFVRCELPRGDQPVDVEVDLEPGRYTLGVGTRPDSIRQVVTVRPPVDR